MTARKVPLSDPGRIYQFAGEKLDTAVLRAARSGWWLNGPFVSEFSKAFAAYIGVEHCIPLANGTDALELAMRAVALVADNGKRDVIMAANAGGYASVAAWAAGLVPVYVDIEEDSQLIDPSRIVEAVGPDTAMVVVTHLYGGLADVAGLKTRLAAAGYPDLPIVEDCAQAHGGMVDGRRVGSIGSIGSFSFYPTKNLGAFGDAGAVATGNADYAAVIRKLHQYGWGARKYLSDVPGGVNSRMDEIQASLLLTVLPDLDANNAARRAVVERYAAAAPQGVRFVKSRLGSVAHLAVALCDDREDLRRHLAEAGVGTDVHYPVLDVDQTGWAQRERKIRSLDVSRRSVGQLVTLPCFPYLADDEVSQVCEALASWRRS